MQDGIEHVRYEAEQLISILGRKFYFDLEHIDDICVNDTDYEIIKKRIEDYKEKHDFECINTNMIEVCDIIFKESDELIKLFNDYKLPHKDLLTRGN